MLTQEVKVLEKRGSHLHLPGAGPLPCLSASPALQSGKTWSPWCDRVRVGLPQVSEAQADASRPLVTSARALNSQERPLSFQVRRLGCG